LRLVGEALGCTVNWDETAREVKIITASESKPDEEKIKTGTSIGTGQDSILETIRDKNFSSGDVLRYTVRGSEVDTYEVLYSYSKDTALYNPVEARLDSIQGSVLVVKPTYPATGSTFRLSEDTIFYDASDKDNPEARNRLSVDEFKRFKDDRILIWSEKALYPNRTRATDDLAALVLRVR